MDLAGALDERPEVHAAALRLHRAGTDAAGIARELGIEVEAVAPLLRVAEAKLAKPVPAWIACCLHPGPPPHLMQSRGKAQAMNYLYSLLQMRKQQPLSVLSVHKLAVA